MEAAIPRFSLTAPGLLLGAGLLLAACADGDPSNLGSYYSCNDWMRAHQAPGTERGRTPDQSRAEAGPLEDWAVQMALDRGYEVTDAPVAGDRVITEQALVRDVTAQCTSDRVLLTLGGAVTTVLDRMDAERASKAR